MVIHLYRNQMRWFREKARRAYPKETLALLVGQRISPQVVGVAYFMYPKTKTTPGGIEVDMSVQEYQDLCEVLNHKSPALKYLGTLHSHPGDTPIMSAEDKANHVACGDSVSGILTVPANGRAALEFWQAKDCLPLKVEYYK